MCPVYCALLFVILHCALSIISHMAIDLAH
jgi:hypothetical protein